MQKYKRQQVALATFNFLFSELITLLSKKDNKDIEGNLKKVGMEMGFRLFGPIALKQGLTERENRIMPILKMVQGPVFKYLFGREADKVSVFSHPRIENRNLYLIRDVAPVILKYIPESNELQCSVFVAGIIQAILCAVGFECEVTSQGAQDKEGNKGSKYPQTEYWITPKEETEKKFRLE